MKLVVLRFWSILRLAIGAALLYLVLSSGAVWSGITRFVAVPWLLPAFAAVTLIGGAIEAQRLRLLLRAQGIHLPLGHSYRLVAIGLFFSYCLPGGTGGDVMKVYYLALSNRRQVVELATVVIVDRVLALFSLLCWVVVLALLNWRLVQEQPLLLGLVAVAIAALAVLFLSGVLSSSALVRASPFHAFVTTRMLCHSYVKRVVDALYVFRNHKRPLLAAGLWSVCGHTGLLLSFAAAGAILVPDSPPLATALLASLGLVANALPLTPGGLGVGETAFDRLFTVVGFTGGATLPLAWRIGSLPFCILGCVFYAAGAKAARPPRGIEEESIPAVDYA